MSNELIKAVRAEPFRPFRIHMGGGRALAVPHPGFIAIAPTGRSAVTFDDPGSPEVLDVIMIQPIESLPPAAASRGARPAETRHAARV